MAIRTLNQQQHFFRQLQMPPKQLPRPRLLSTSSQPIKRLSLIKALQHQATINILDMGWRSAARSISQ
ncbi:hypothetical protein TNCV_2889511 [Trichonephila clavipes]|nr:hypothetical protein TNCV_2889511 [Trichonephila clavipes]